jgi:hypothetical protein
MKLLSIRESCPLHGAAPVRERISYCSLTVAAPYLSRSPHSTHPPLTAVWKNCC